MEYVSNVLLKKDDNDANFIHLYIPGNYYLCSLHIDSLYDLFGEYNQKEIKNLLANGGLVPFTLGLQLQS
jgi:hypothetical protein